MRMLATFLVASGVFAGQDCDADHVSAFQIRTVAESTVSEQKSVWTLSGEACAGYRSLDEDDCRRAAAKVNRRSRLKIVPTRYRLSRPRGCYRYKRRVWFNPAFNPALNGLLRETSAQPIVTRGRKPLCRAEKLNLLSGEVCFDSAIRTHPADEAHCNYAARLANKYQRLKLVPTRYQQRRPAGCYKYKGTVWWNAHKSQNPNATRITKKGRETVCYPEQYQSFLLDQAGLVPEGIAHSSSTGFIVGSLRGQGLHKVQLAGGVAEAELFAKPANMAANLGVHIANGKVFATQVGGFPSPIGLAGVWVLDAESAAVVCYADLGPMAIERGDNITLNDVTVDGEGFIYATDTFTGIVYKISPDCAEVAALCTIPEALFGSGAIVNGLDWVPGTQTLLVNIFDQGAVAPYKGAVYSVDTIGGGFHKVIFHDSVIFHGLDGLVVDGCCTAYSVDARERKVFQYTTEDNWGTAAVSATSNTTQCQQPTTGAVVDGDFWVVCVEGFGEGPYYVEKVSW